MERPRQSNVSIGFWLGLIISCLLGLVAKAITNWSQPESQMVQLMVALYIGAGSGMGATLGWVSELRREKRKLQQFKELTHETFQNKEWWEMVQRKLTSLANLTDLMSQRVIELQRGGLRESGRLSEELDLLVGDANKLEKEFDTAYKNANAEFRAAQAAFYAYYDLAEPFSSELGLMLVGRRNFRSHTSPPETRSRYEKIQEAIRLAKTLVDEWKKEVQVPPGTGTNSKEWCALVVLNDVSSELESAKGQLALRCSEV